jgi:prepilin signal peptidase PulO-like enzyme (type II secretory pathway)
VAISTGIVAALFGLIFGSAINALVWRIKVGKSWVHGRSECSVCHHPLAPKDLVPVLSWLLLRGKCRYCHKPIADHPVVELVTALVFGVSAYVLSPSTTTGWLMLGMWLLIVVMLIILAVYDTRWMILPDKVMIPLVAAALVMTVAFAVVHHSPQVALGSFEAAVLAGGAFYLLVVLTKGRAMGGGDIKLAFAMGLILGIQGTAIAMFLAFDCAAVVGLAMIMMRLRSRRDQIPFGPYLVGGTLVAFLFGRLAVAWYLRLNGAI